MMTMFTSGRDYRPGAFWGNALPPNAVYARVLVYARSQTDAEAALIGSLSRYAETLAPVGELDGPGEALLRYATAETPVPPGAVFVLYRVERDVDGNRLPVPALRVRQLLPGGELHPIGVARVVSMGRPEQPWPTVRIVPDDVLPDAVPVPDQVEGPDSSVGLVTGALAFPPGQAGASARRAEESLTADLEDIRAELAYAVELIRSVRISTDPRLAWLRQSDRIGQLAHKLTAVAAAAKEVETALKGTP